MLGRPLIPLIPDQGHPKRPKTAKNNGARKCGTHACGSQLAPHSPLPATQPALPRANAIHIQHATSLQQLAPCDRRRSGAFHRSGGSLRGISSRPLRAAYSRYSAFSAVRRARAGARAAAPALPTRLELQRGGGWVGRWVGGPGYGGCERVGEYACLERWLMIYI